MQLNNPYTCPLIALQPSLMHTSKPLFRRSLLDLTCAAFFPGIARSSLFSSGSWVFDVAPQLPLSLFAHGRNEAQEIAQYEALGGGLEPAP